MHFNSSTWNFSGVLSMQTALDPLRCFLNLNAYSPTFLVIFVSINTSTVRESMNCMKSEKTEKNWTPSMAAYWPLVVSVEYSTSGGFALIKLVDKCFEWFWSSNHQFFLSQTDFKEMLRFQPVLSIDTVTVWSGHHGNYLLSRMADRCCRALTNQNQVFRLVIIITLNVKRRLILNGWFRVVVWISESKFEWKRKTFRGHFSKNVHVLYWMATWK